MPTVEQVLAVAAKYLGYTEDPPGTNCNQFSKRLGRKCEYWCADGISAVGIEAGMREWPNTASTRAMRDFYQSRGRYDIQPRRGDIGEMHLTGRNGRGQPDHVGLVLGYDAVRKIVHTLEFNTSPGDEGSQDNGGCVALKHRPLSKFVGFGHPNYDTPDHQEDDMYEQADRVRDEKILEVVARIDAETDALSVTSRIEGKIDSIIGLLYTENGGWENLSDDDVNRIKVAVNDEADRRDRERLGAGDTPS